MELPNTYRCQLQFREERAVLLPEEKPIDITSINQGILFVLAKWSGSSQISFRTLNAALAEFKNLSDLKLFIADTDSKMTEKFFEQIGEIPSGDGETYWIKDGTIIARGRKFEEIQKQLILENTNRLLSGS